MIFDLFTLISVIGCVIWFVRNRRSERAALLAILAGYVLIVFIGVVRWTMMTPASQGRLMFPAIAVISLLIWLGWETVFNFRFSISNDQLTVNKWSRLRWIMPVFMLVAALIVPFRDITTTYAGPQMITEEQLPADLKRLEINYGDQLRLVGYRPGEPLARTDSAEFTLYWQCLRPPTADFSIFAIVYGRQWQEVGKRDAYPYRGLFATRQCQPGAVFADPYKIPIDHNAQSPAWLRAQIGVKDWAAAAELVPTSNGASVPAVMVPVGKLASVVQTTHPHTMTYQVGDHIMLLDAGIDQNAAGSSLSLTWQATAAPPEGYTTFVHILDVNGRLIGQADGPPLNGDYPTDWWSPGETIMDERPLSLPPEADRVTIGLYRLSDGMRLPVVDANGQRVLNDEIVLSVRP
jgi:hypothetical protein